MLVRNAHYSCAWLCIIMHQVCEQIKEQKFDLQNTLLSKMFCHINTPRDKNILPWTIFTRKYPTVNFFQTMVCNYNAILTNKKVN